MARNSRFFLAAIGLALVVALAALWSMGVIPGGAANHSGAAEAKSAPGAASAPAQVFMAHEVMRARREPLARQIEISGALSAPDSAVVRAKAAGVLQELRVKEGDRVRAGQVLGRIDLPDLRARLADRQAQIDAARAALAEAERQTESTRELAAQGFLAPSALSTAQSRLDGARAQLQSARAQAAAVGSGAADALLVAPIGGIVARRHAVVGEKLSPEQQVIGLVDLARLELAAHVGTHEVALLAPGQAVQVAVEGLAQPVAARIDRIAPAAEPGTRSIAVMVGVPNPDERLRAGQYAMARLELPDPVPRLVVPGTALATASGQTYVWVIDDGALARRTVTTGRRDSTGRRVEIVDGLSEGVLVLAERFDNLREGMRASVAASGAVAAPATVVR